MKIKQEMGEVTSLAYSFIEEDLLVMNDHLDAMDVLDFLQDGDNFKQISDLLKETMISACIPSETSIKLKEYSTISDYLSDIKNGYLDIALLTATDATDSFVNALFALLAKQEDESLYQKRKFNWNRPTVYRWFSETQNNGAKSGCSESIRNREDAIAICFALGLDYPSSRDFLNKSGHAIFNVRNYQDAIYIYCLTNQKPLSVAKKLIYEYNNKVGNNDITPEESIAHTGNTTLFLATQILGDSSWENDDDFLNTFLIPNTSNFLSYSRTALKEYYTVKNPIYLASLKEHMTYEKDGGGSGLGFDARKIQEYIHASHRDFDVTVPISSVQVTRNFIKNLPKYASSSILLKEANDMLDIHVDRLDSGWKEKYFKTRNNTLEVTDYIIDNYPKYSNNENELETISDFLTKTVTAYKMLCTWLPSVVIDDEQDKDKRQRSYRESSLRDTVLSSFPHRNFFTLFEKNPGELCHDGSLRKTIILLHYIKYASNLLNEIPNSTGEEMGFYNFYETMNEEVLRKCQLGTLYYANHFDWLVLESIKKIETHSDDNDKENPVSFLNEVLSLSFDPEEDNERDY